MLIILSNNIITFILSITLLLLLIVKVICNKFRYKFIINLNALRNNQFLVDSYQFLIRKESEFMNTRNSHYNVKKFPERQKVCTQRKNMYIMWVLGFIPKSKKEQFSELRVERLKKEF